MCVIIIKPSGVEMPSISELRMAKSVHPHGFGVVSLSCFYKGLSFNTFVRTLKTIPIEDACVIHLRFATHGSIKQSNCHPFNEGDVWFAHNGVLNIRPQKDMTDSETAFKQILYPAIETYGLYSSQFATIANTIIGSSRFVFFQNGNIKIFGNFYEHCGRYYSNLKHISYMY